MISPPPLLGFVSSCCTQKSSKLEPGSGSSPPPGSNTLLETERQALKTLFVVRSLCALLYTPHWTARHLLPKPRDRIVPDHACLQIQMETPKLESVAAHKLTNRSTRAHGLQVFPAMSWSSALGRLRPKTVWSSLVRPGCAMVVGRRPSAQGGGLGAALAGNSSTHHRSSDELATMVDPLGQRRGMATSNSRHKKVIKMAKG